MKKNNRTARAARTLAAFSDVVYPTTMWTHNSKSLILYIKFYGALSVICQQYRMRAKSNNCKIVTIAQVFIFMRRFIYRSRRGGLNFLLSADGYCNENVASK